MDNKIPYPRDYFDGPEYSNDLSNNNILDYLESERTKLIDNTDSPLVDYLTSPEFDGALEKFAIGYQSHELSELLTKSSIRAALDVLSGRGTVYAYIALFAGGVITEGELFNYINVKSWEYRDNE